MDRTIGLPAAPSRPLVAIATGLGVVTTLALAGIGLAGCGGCDDLVGQITASGTGILPLLAGIVVWTTIAFTRGPLSHRAVVTVFGLLHVTIAIVWALDGLLDLGGMPGAAWGAPTALLAAIAAFVSFLPRYARATTPATAT